MSDDLISRQEVINVLNDGAELLRRFLDETYVVGDERTKYEWGLGLIESYIYEMDGLPSAQQWILCSERLPEYCKEVLAVTSIGGIYVAKYEAFDTEWHETVEYRRLLGVSAWMPLPEPYKEERKES